LKLINLEKRYGNILAVGGINLKIERGEIFGLVGADGAGKSTTIRMLCTLISTFGGRGQSLGMDIVRQAGKVKEKPGTWRSGSICTRR